MIPKFSKYNTEKREMCRSHKHIRKCIGNLTFDSWETFPESLAELHELERERRRIPNMLHQNLIQFCGQSCGSTLREHRAVSWVCLEKDLTKVIRSKGSELTDSLEIPSRTVTLSLMSL